MPFKHKLDVSRRKRVTFNNGIKLFSTLNFRMQFVTSQLLEC